MPPNTRLQVQWIIRKPGDPNSVVNYVFEWNEAEDDQLQKGKWKLPSRQGHWENGELSWKSFEVGRGRVDRVWTGEVRFEPIVTGMGRYDLDVRVRAFAPDGDGSIRIPLDEDLSLRLSHGASSDVSKSVTL